MAATIRELPVYGETAPRSVELHVEGDSIFLTREGEGAFIMEFALSDFRDALRHELSYESV